MKPLILHMPDSVRDELEAALCQAMPDIPKKIERKDFKRIGAAVSDVLFRYEKDTEAGSFLRELQEAYLGMKVGTSAPVVLLDNLPPTHGRLVMYGLGALEGEIIFGEQKDHENQDANAAAAHRDSSHRQTRKGSKLGQFLYCENAGTNPQSTVFITADEIIDWMARNNADTDYMASRSNIINRLEQIHINSDFGEKIPLLSRNPAYSPDNRQNIPEFIAFTLDRSLNDVRKIDAKDLAVYRAFSEAADQVIEHQTSEAIASTQNNSLVLWNDLLTMHARAKTRDGRDEDPLSGRMVEIMETKWQHEPKPPHMAIAAPCTTLDLSKHPVLKEGLIKHGHLREI